MAHRFVRDGVKLPSVTAITGQLDKPALVSWAANSACDYIISEIEGNDEMVRVGDLYPIITAARKNFRRVSTQGLNIGKETHKAIGAHLKDELTPVEISEEAKPALAAFLSWKEEKKPETLHVELKLIGDRYGGICDWICMLDGKKYVIDFKVAKDFYPEHYFQVAAYRALDPTIEGCGILRLDRETGLPEWNDTSDRYELDLVVVNSLTDLWYAKKALAA